MTSYSDYYETKLYPLQDGVLSCAERCNADFFLTGGTALSRGYFGHRYSDDLDFFLCSDPLYGEKLERVFSALREDGFQWAESDDFVRTSDYATCVVSHDRYPGVSLKLDFVNDSAPRFGDIARTPLFFRTDSLRNILSNKITALFRFEAKDVADIFAICKNYPFRWSESIDEARKKEVGVEAPVAAEILLGLPEEDFQAIRWRTIPAWCDFQRDLRVIASDLANGTENSLFSRMGD
jgi:Uncharacterized conserved protein